MVNSRGGEGEGGEGGGVEGVFKPTLNIGVVVGVAQIQHASAKHGQHHRDLMALSEARHVADEVILVAGELDGRACVCVCVKSCQVRHVCHVCLVCLCVCVCV